jgi:serine/threonine protein kinase
MGVPTDSPSLGRLQLSRASGSVGLGKYRVFASLGRGGMADVQLAAAQGPKGFQKLAVVKRLRPLLADDAAVVNMFLDEARLAARLNHPNLIHTYEFGEENGTYFIVMEFLEGQPLNELLYATRASSAPKVSPGLWAKIIADALAGLHCAHELRDYDGTPLDVVHRDVSPQNIVVTYDGGVKLVDFGIAKASVNATKTESQIIKGKLAYMAPEQADVPDGTVIDRRADIFAMGIVLWECLAKRRLATGDDARAIVSRIMNLEFQPPSRFNPDVPPELDAIARRALELVPANRFPTALAMREALERFLRTREEMVDETTIGSLVSSLFAREREDIHRQIRVEMAELGPSRDLTVADSTPSQRVARAAFEGAAPALPLIGVPSPHLESAGSLRAVRTSVTSDPRGTRIWWLVAAAAAALVILAAFVAMRGPADRPSASPSLPMTTAVVAPPPPAATVEPAASSALETRSVEAGAPASMPPLRPAPAPRVAPPRSPAGPPKLEADPWR